MYSSYLLIDKFISIRIILPDEVHMKSGDAHYPNCWVIFDGNIERFYSLTRDVSQ